MPLLGEGDAAVIQMNEELAAVDVQAKSCPWGRCRHAQIPGFGSVSMGALAKASRLEKVGNGPKF